jgi:transposase
MPTQSKRALPELSEADLGLLKDYSKSRTLPKREVERAQILLYYYQKMPLKSIMLKIPTTRPTINKCIDKAIAMGWQHGLKDLPHNPKNSSLTFEAKAWVVNIACTKPKDLGFAAEVWSRQSLANYIRSNAKEKGHLCLTQAAKATVHRILKENKLQPQKVKYYLEKRDPDFDDKMHQILVVYQEVALLNSYSSQNSDPDQKNHIVTICADEKPGVQAIANVVADLPPVAGKHSSIGRDYEYVRHGTASILAGIDLHNGHVFAQVKKRHRSCEFIELLQEIDQYYPPATQIRIVLDNHSTHISKETRAFLGTKPGRFIYVHTPKHGSWLNLAETLFSKMARTFLRHIRVASWEELKERILKWVEETNQNPVVHRWNKFDVLCEV